MRVQACGGEKCEGLVEVGDCEEGERKFKQKINRCNTCISKCNTCINKIEVF